MSKVKLLSSECFKNDPITIAVNSLNDVLRELGYKCTGIDVRPLHDLGASLYVISGYVVTKETYLKFKEETK